MARSAPRVATVRISIVNRVYFVRGTFCLSNLLLEAVLWLAAGRCRF